MLIQVVDPSAFTPPYDDALCTALARAGAQVQLITSPFAYGEPPAPHGYLRRELFYRRVRGAPGTGARRVGKLVEHVPDMLRFRRAAQAADVVHVQWLTLPAVDVHLLPDRPLVLTAHDLLPREPRPGQLRAQRELLRRVDAVVVHSEYGRGQLVDRLGLPGEKVEVIRHGAFAPGAAGSLPSEVVDSGEPVVLFFGLLRAYKGIGTLLEAWRGVAGAQLWIVGRPMMELPPIGPGVQLVPRFVSDGEAEALMQRADLVVLPYTRTERFDQSGVLAKAMGAGRPSVVTDIGGFGEVAVTGAARLVAPDDPQALGETLAELVADPAQRERMSAAALAAARGPFSWEESARRTLALYERIRRG